MFRKLAATALLTVCVMAQAAAQPPVIVVFFPLWSGALDDAALNVVQQAAVIAKQHAGAHVTVTGYADATGSQAADMYLTQLRAQRVVDQLQADGVPAAQLEMVAKGAQAEPGQAGRRVEIAISAP